jgi:glycosyltransferase involved in cell wall biosynthesis
LGYRSQPFGGGQGVYMRFLSKALVDAGHSVDVISGPPYPHLDPRVRLIQLPSLDLFEHGLGSLRPHHLKSYTNIVEWLGKLTGGFAEPYAFGRRAARYLRQHGHNYDLIHDNQCLSYGMLDIQDMGLPLVTTIHHPITSDLRIALAAARNWRERLFIKRWHSFLNMQKKVVKRLHNIVTVSDCSRQDIARDFGLQPASISVVHNGICTEEFRPLPQVTRLPNRLMATCSADAPLKGARYLFRAYARLLETYPDLELLLISKLNPGGATEKLVRELGIEDRVQFVSGITTDEMAHYYAQATLAICPSVYEGFGLPAGEAMACGVPVVSSDGGALPEVVGDAGVLVPARDVDALVAAIDALLQDPKRRDELGAKAKKRIEDHFCWNVCAKQMTDYYYQVLANENR